MKKGSAINIALVLAILLLLGVFGLFVRVRPVADQVAVVKTEGIDCAEAIADLEKVLQLKKGVAAIEVNTNDGWVIVGYDSNRLRAESIATTIAELGYPVSTAETLSMDRFQEMTGREPGGISPPVGCGGLCGAWR